MISSLFQTAQATLSGQGSVVLAIRAKPGARQTQAQEQLADGSYKIAVSAVAEDGAANAELIRYIAGEFGVPRGCVEILAGAGARRKLVRIVR